MAHTRACARRLINCFVVLALVLVTAVAAAPTAAAEDVTTNPGAAGWDAAIQLDANDHPVIAYTSRPYALNILQCGDPTCSSGNNTISLPGQYVSPSLAIDSTGRPMVAALDLANTQLVVFGCTDATCTSLTDLARPDDDTRLDAGPSIVLDAEDRPIIANWSKGDRQPRIIHCGDPLCLSNNSIALPDPGVDTWTGSNIVLSSAGLPVVAYRDFASNQVRVLRCGNVACTANNSINSAGSATDVGTISLALGSDDAATLAMNIQSDGVQLRTCNDLACTDLRLGRIEVAESSLARQSLALTQADTAVVAYLDYDRQDLRVRSCANDFCSTSNVQIPGDGDYEGLGAALALDANGFPVIAHRNVTQDLLEVLRCDDPNCAADAVEPGNDLGGDANCDGIVNILDAAATAQYVVQARAGAATCAQATQASDISLAAVSIDDRPVTILNAFWVSECVVGLVRPLCPDQGAAQLPVLSGAGLGPFTFGDNIGEVVGYVEAALGEPPTMAYDQLYEQWHYLWPDVSLFSTTNETFDRWSVFAEASRLPISGLGEYQGDLQFASEPASLRATVLPVPNSSALGVVRWLNYGVGVQWRFAPGVDQFPASLTDIGEVQVREYSSIPAWNELYRTEPSRDNVPVLSNSYAAFADVLDIAQPGQSYVVVEERITEGVAYAIAVPIDETRWTGLINLADLQPR